MHNHWLECFLILECQLLKNLTVEGRAQNSLQILNFMELTWLMAHILHPQDEMEYSTVILQGKAAACERGG